MFSLTMHLCLCTFVCIGMYCMYVQVPVVPVYITQVQYICFNSLTNRMWERRIRELTVVICTTVFICV